MYTATTLGIDSKMFMGFDRKYLTNHQHSDLEFAGTGHSDFMDQYWEAVPTIHLVLSKCRTCPLCYRLQFFTHAIQLVHHLFYHCSIETVTLW